jgi:hypothetical protein
VSEGSCNDEGCSDTGQTDAIDSCAEKDRCATKSAMGKGEGRKENGLGNLTTVLQADYASRGAIPIFYVLLVGGAAIRGMTSSIV